MYCHFYLIHYLCFTCIELLKIFHETFYFPSHNIEVEVFDDGRLQLVELSPIDPWLADPRQPLELQEGEVKVCLLYYL